MSDHKKTSSEDIKAMARSASDLLSNQAFNRAVLDLRKQWFGELMTTTGDYEEIQRIIAQLRALEAIPAHMQTYINDRTVMEKR